MEMKKQKFRMYNGSKTEYVEELALIKSAKYEDNEILYTDELNLCYEYTIPEAGLVLTPDVLYLMQTNEECGSEVYQPCYDGRSSMARLGIQSHISAGFGDVGFISKWTLEVTVIHPVKIYPDIRIGQVYFNTVEGDIKLYNGKYNNNNNIISRSFNDFNK